MNRSLDAPILAAALSGVAELGYDRMSMDDLAARAGVGKAAIYRRWSSKAEVVAEAIAHWRRLAARLQASRSSTMSFLRLALPPLTGARPFSRPTVRGNMPLAL